MAVQIKFTLNDTAQEFQTARTTHLQPSDTAYPRFKSRPSPAELERFYTPTQEEQAYGAPTTRLGFMLLLKSFQRLGYFVVSSQIPQVIVEHIATAIGRRIDPEDLRRYDESQARRKHLAAVRKFLDVKPFGAAGQALLREAVNDAAMTKEDVADIVNVGIEMLVRSRYELPAFDTLVSASMCGPRGGQSNPVRASPRSLGRSWRGISRCAVCRRGQSPAGQSLERPQARPRQANRSRHARVAGTL